MTLPPVVSDPEVCYMHPGFGQWGDDWAPHLWDLRRTGRRFRRRWIEVCRYCGDRKPS